MPRGWGLPPVVSRWIDRCARPRERDSSAAMGLAIMNHTHCLAGCLCLLALIPRSGAGEDWPAYRHDSGRSSVTSEHLGRSLREAWVYRARHAPRPAWPASQWNEAKAVFDRVLHVVTRGDKIYFASSADGKVYALDGNTGREEWTYFTGGPIRLPPTVSGDRLYAGSDDGWVYCLSADTGRLAWSFRAAPSGRKVVGHGRIISPWPIRTGVLVAEGVAYVAAGLFPSEGVFLHALDAATGKVRWKNDSAGAIYARHPHPGCDGFSGVSPQGAMVLAGDRLFVPTGRSVPAAFDRRNGKLLYWHHGASWKGTVRDGGAEISLLDNAVFASPGNTDLKVYSGAFNTDTGDKVLRTTEKQIIGTTDTVYLLAKTHIRAVDRTSFWETEQAMEVELDGLQSWYKKRTPEEDARLEQLLARGKAHRRGKAGAKWTFAYPGLQGMILAGNTIYAGGMGRVVAVDAETGKKLWEAPVDGRAGGLAAARGRLFVSTDKGAIHCFAETTKAREATPDATVEEAAVLRDGPADLYEQAATAIVQRSGVRKGYCLILAGGAGRLAVELARQTELHMVCIEADSRLVAEARNRLDQAGFYGVRATAHHARDDGPLPLPDFSVNLVVCDTLLTSGRLPRRPEDLLRVLKPLGGVVMLGQPAEAPRKVKATDLRAWLAPSAELDMRLVEESGTWLLAKRGKLPGAGEWTHQFGNAAGTVCSEDRRVRGPLELLWFGEPGPMKGVKGSMSPLCIGGRLFIGVAPVQAYDAYNGVKLWETTIRDTGLMAATSDSVYVTRRKTDRCERLDAATGELRTTLKLPSSGDSGQPGWWGYLAVDGDRLLATTLSAFQLDPADNALGPGFAGLGIMKRIRQAEGRVTLHSSRHWLIRQMDSLMKEIDEGPGNNLPPERLARYKERMLRLLAGTSSRSLHALDRKTGRSLWEYAPPSGGYICHSAIAAGDGTVFLVEGRETQGRATTKHLVALSVETGEKQWETQADLTDYCKPGKFLHRPPHRVLVNSTDALSLAYRNGVLVLAEVWGGRNLFALSAADGAFLWSQPVRYNYYYRRRPVVVGNTVYTDTRGYDLRTGRPRGRTHPITGRQSPWSYSRSYGCGGSSASAGALFFRSSVLSYLDLEADQGVTNIGGVRPGCWINAIPAAGLLLAPDQTRGCTCPYPIKATVVLRPTKRQRTWSFVTLEGPAIPVRRFAINLGAPGDRRDRNGTLWFGYPRPFHPRGFRFSLDADYLPGQGFFAGAADGGEIAGTFPWIGSSGCAGLRKLVIRLDEKGFAPGTFDLDLYFSDPEAREGERVFDVAVEVQTRITDLDIVRLAGGTDRELVRQVRGVKAADTLTIELIARPAPDASKPLRAPLLNGLLVRRTSSLPDPRAPSRLLTAGKPIAKWDWKEPNPLANRIEPGVYDALPRGGATASGGKATVRDGGTLGKPAGVKDDSFVTLGKIRKLQGATAFMWTFEDIRFNRVGGHILVGSIQD